MNTGKSELIDRTGDRDGRLPRGYIAHDTIVVTAWDAKHLVGAHAKAMELFGEQVGAISPPAINGYVAFFVPPDGSKEGWGASDEGDRRRAALIEWMQETDDYIDFVAVRFGGDFGCESAAKIKACSFGGSA